ncbi:hypothetical protein ACMDCR_23230 [Labrys okinawensis]|uniref:hypothetical protein n=1 Tax=Labrys okinawensis TaxID=346911 RepID=UPI0039BD2482
MLRLVSVSLFAGAMLAAAPVAAQEQPAQQQPAQGQPVQDQPVQGQPAQQQAPQAQAAPIGNEFCSKDLQPMLGRREEIAKLLQGINKRPKPKTFEQLKRNFNDFCGNLGTYIANDQKMLDYMTKNKDFCAITDQNIQQITTDMKQTQSTRTRICSHPPRQQVAPEAKGPGGQAIPKPPVNLRLQ